MLSPSLRQFHDSVYVLTIPSATDRQAGVIQQLGEGNFEFVYGVDKNDVTKDELIQTGIYDEVMARTTDRRNKIMTLGHICCSLGHRMIYEKFLETDRERCLIFEDDVVCLDVAEPEVEQAISNAPEDAELIYLGWRGGSYSPWYGPAKKMLYHAQHSLGLLKYDHTMIDNLYARPFNEYFDRAGKHFMTHAYSVTRRAAEILVKWNTPIRLNSDNALMYAVLSGDITAYIARKPMFGQRSADEDDSMQALTA